MISGACRMKRHGHAPPRPKPNTMQVKKDVRQIAREMLRASFTDGQLDRGRITSVVDSILAKKPRNYLKILEYYKRLLRLEAEKRHARIETATALEPQITSQISKHRQPTAARLLLRRAQLPDRAPSLSAGAAQSLPRHASHRPRLLR